MRPFSTSLRVLALSLLLPLASALTAQDLNDPGAYMTAISNAETEMNKTYMAYLSAVAHSKARKVEKLRQQTVESITNCKYKIIDVPFYKGDNSLRKSSITYVDMVYKVFNDDYAHIVNIEELAEQSFDEMQLYILLQEKTDEKLRQAYDTMYQASKNFAKKYNVTVIETKSELDDKMEISSKVNHYKNQLYLIFFKCNWQDQRIDEAINQKKFTGIEQARNALGNYAKEGLLALDSLSNFKGDHSLAQACRQALLFYQTHAETNLPKMTDFFLKEENLAKMKKSIDSKPQSSLTKQEIDAYNKAVGDFNVSVNAYNQLNDNINQKRDQVIQAWSEAEKQFLDAHVPHYKS